MQSETAAELTPAAKASKAGRFPPQVFFIVGNEACERFSFYGMTSILVLYLAKQMMMGDARAKETYHLFVMAIYFLPLLGGWLADRWLGRYNTILYVSLFYCLGHGTLAMFGRTLPGVYAGLAFIALGAGGIKPNVSAFVGDQFGPEQGSWLTKIYGWFYWSVNVGALFAFVLIPKLREREGYGWAFGVPGIFMGLATLVFWMGTKYYTRVPPGIELKQAGFLQIIWYALTNRSRRPGAGFFASANERFRPEEVEGAKAVLRILLVFASVPVFWSLYLQVNSTWVIQGEKMVPCFRGRWYEVNAEVMQSAGALLVLIWVPVMTIWLYPLAGCLGLRPTPLRRMALGMILTAVTFGICGYLQTFIDGGQKLSIAWQLVPYIVLEAGEVLLSATALEFAFGEAPANMKSTIMSFWYLTSSLGSFLVAAVTALNQRYVNASGAKEYAFYAVLMLVAAGIFIVCASFYRPRITQAASTPTTA